MSSDDHSLIPSNRAELARKRESDSPILAKMARDLLVKAKAQLANDAPVHFQCLNLKAATRSAFARSAMTAGVGFRSPRSIPPM